MIPFPKTLPILATATLHLRPLTEADIAPWFARATDAESALLAADPIPASIAEGLAWLARHHARFHDQTGLRWAIVPGPVVAPGTQASIGTIGLTFPTPGLPIAELGYVIARSHWNQGQGTSAARLVVRYAFQSLGLTELHAETLRRNHASRRILEKLGFRHHRAIAATPPAEPEDFDLYVLGTPIGRM